MKDRSKLYQISYGEAGELLSLKGITNQHKSAIQRLVKWEGTKRDVETLAKMAEKQNHKKLAAGLREILAIKRTNPKRRKAKRANPGRIMVTAEPDDMGNLTVYPVSDRIQRMYGNKGLFFNADTANLYDFIEHNVPKSKRGDLDRGYSINFLLSEDAFSAWVGEI